MVDSSVGAPLITHVLLSMLTPVGRFGDATHEVKLVPFIPTLVPRLTNGRLSPISLAALPTLLSADPKPNQPPGPVAGGTYPLLPQHLIEPLSNTAPACV